MKDTENGPISRTDKLFEQNLTWESYLSVKIVIVD